MTILSHNLNFLKRLISMIVVVVFVTTSILPNQAFAQSVLNLPAAGSAVPVSAGFAPAMIKGINLYPDNPLKFDFIIDQGQETFSDANFKKESTKLIKYFLAALTVPENEMWVNLSPYEKNRIVPESFGQTEMGRDLLAQDYMLKQLTASLMNPDDKLGGEFWQRVYAKAQEKYGTTDIPMNTFNKIWIIPEKAVVYEHEKGAYVVKSHLKVLLEEDYLALHENGLQSTVYGQTADGRLQTVDIPSEKVISGLQSQIVKDLLIPEIEKEVNEGKTFANLRQIYNAVILASWYKQALKESILNQVFVDQKKLKGVETDDKTINEHIYNQYVESFKKGVYNYVKEDYNPETQEVVNRKYFSGGANLAVKPEIETGVNAAMLGDAAQLPTNVTVDLAMTNDTGELQSKNQLSQIQQEYKAYIDSQRQEARATFSQEMVNPQGSFDFILRELPTLTRKYEKLINSINRRYKVLSKIVGHKKAMQWAKSRLVSTGLLSLLYSAEIDKSAKNFLAYNEDFEKVLKNLNANLEKGSNLGNGYIGEIIDERRALKILEKDFPNIEALIAQVNHLFSLYLLSLEMTLTMSMSEQPDVNLERLQQLLDASKRQGYVRKATTLLALKSTLLSVDQRILNLLKYNALFNSKDGTEMMIVLTKYVSWHLMQLNTQISGKSLMPAGDGATHDMDFMMLFYSVNRLLERYEEITALPNSPENQQERSDIAEALLMALKSSPELFLENEHFEEIPYKRLNFKWQLSWQNIRFMLVKHKASLAKDMYALDFDNKAYFPTDVFINSPNAILKQLLQQPVKGIDENGRVQKQRIFSLEDIITRSDDPEVKEYVDEMTDKIIASKTDTILAYKNSRTQLALDETVRKLENLSVIPATTGRAAAMLGAAAQVPTNVTVDLAMTTAPQTPIIETMAVQAERGLHNRVAARITTLLTFEPKNEVEVFISNEHGDRADARSIIGLMLLGISQNKKATVEIKAPQDKAQQLLENISGILKGDAAMSAFQGTVLTEASPEHDNEDAVYLNEDLGIAMVADGIGGYPGGRESSQIAVQTVKEMITEEVLNKIKENTNLYQQYKDMTKLIATVIQTIDKRIMTFKESDEFKQKLAEENDQRPTKYAGTTINLVVIAKETSDQSRQYYFNSGNSPLYAKDSTKQSKKLSRDDTKMLDDSAWNKTVKPEDKGSALTSALGWGQFVNSVSVDLMVKSRAVNNGETYILMTDGISDIGEEAIQEILSQHDDQNDIVNALMAQSKKMGIVDDKSVVVFKKSDAAMKSFDLGDQGLKNEQLADAINTLMQNGEIEITTKEDESFVFKYYFDKAKSNFRINFNEGEGFVDIHLDQNLSNANMDVQLWGERGIPPEDYVQIEERKPAISNASKDSYRGLGRALMILAEGVSRTLGVKIFTAEYMSDQKFYSDLGFVPIGLAPSYSMQKDLTTTTLPPLYFEKRMIPDNQNKASEEKVNDYAKAGDSTKGGIDLNPTLLNTEVKRTGRGVIIPTFKGSAPDLSGVEGFVPNIINITPITNLPLHLGIVPKDKKEETTEVSMKLSVLCIREEMLANHA